jgi:integrase
VHFPSWRRFKFGEALITLSRRYDLRPAREDDQCETRDSAFPLSERAREILDLRRGAESPWVFSAATVSGHLERSTLKRQHEKACKLAKIPVFVPYRFRHTCLTRWARILDPYTLATWRGKAIS